MYNGGQNKALDLTGLLRLGLPHLKALSQPFRWTPHPQAWRGPSPVNLGHPSDSLGNNQEPVNKYTTFPSDEFRN